MVLGSDTAKFSFALFARFIFFDSPNWIGFRTLHGRTLNLTFIKTWRKSFFKQKKISLWFFQLFRQRAPVVVPGDGVDKLEGVHGAKEANGRGENPHLDFLHKNIRKRCCSNCIKTHLEELEPAEP